MSEECCGGCKTDEPNKAGNADSMKKIARPVSKDMIINPVIGAKTQMPVSESTMSQSEQVRNRMNDFRKQ